MTLPALRVQWIVDCGSRAVRLIHFDAESWPLGETVWRCEHGIFEDAQLRGVDQQVQKNRSLAAMAEMLARQIRLHRADDVEVWCTGRFRAEPIVKDRLQLILEDIRVRLLPEEEETKQSSLGAVAGIQNRFGDQGRQTFVTFDVGGGSTEIGLVTGGGFFRGGSSFPVGVSSSVVAPLFTRQLERIETFLDQQYHESYGLIPVATCGIASRVAQQFLRLADYDSNRIHGTVLSADFLAELSMRRLESAPEVGRGAGFLLRLLSAVRGSWICVSESGWPSRLVQSVKP